MNRRGFLNLAATTLAATTEPIAGLLRRNVCGLFPNGNTPRTGGMIPAGTPVCWSSLYPETIVPLKRYAATFKIKEIDLIEDALGPFNPELNRQIGRRIAAKIEAGVLHVL